MTYIIQNRIIRICENEKDYGDQILQVDHFIKSCLFLISIIKSVMSSFFSLTVSYFTFLKLLKFLSEISTFFRKNDSDHAMFAIMDVIKGIRMNEWTLFGRKSRCNSKYSLLQVFQLLLVCPCFMIRNPFNIYGSPLGGKLGCRKDVF